VYDAYLLDKDKADGPWIIEYIDFKAAQSAVTVLNIAEARIFDLAVHTLFEVDQDDADTMVRH